MTVGIMDGNVRGLYLVSLSLDPANVATITTAEQDFTVPGVHATDIAIAFNLSAAVAGLGVAGVRVKATDTISVVFVNPTAAGINAAAQTCTVVIARPDVPTLPAKA